MGVNLDFVGKKKVIQKRILTEGENSEMQNVGERKSFIKGLKLTSEM